jgi:hypothetical protein
MYTQADFFQVFGHISVFFATWDILLTMLLVRLVREEIELPDLARATLGQKLRFLEGLTSGQVSRPEVLDRLFKILPDAIAVSEERNRFIHDQWVFAPSGIPNGEITRITFQSIPGRRFNTIEKKLSIRDLNAFLRSVGHQQQIFGSFLTELESAAPGTAPKTS